MVMAMLRVRQASRCCTDLRLRLAHLVVGWWPPASESREPRAESLHGLAAWPMDIPSSGCWELVLRDMSVMRTGRGALLVRGEKDLSLASVCHAVRSAAPCITC